MLTINKWVLDYFLSSSELHMLYMYLLESNVHFILKLLQRF